MKARLASCLLMALLLASSQIQATGNKSTFERDMKRAGEMSAMAQGEAARAFQLARLAVEAGDGSGALIKKAISTACGIDTPERIAYIKYLRDNSRALSGPEKEKTIEAANRLERAVSAVWPLRAIAGLLVKEDKNAAGNLLDKALEKAKSIPDARQRELELRAIAAEYARLDSRKAVRIADSISAPLIKSWALRSAGEAASSLPLLERALMEAESADPSGIEGLSAPGTRHVRAEFMYRKTADMADAALAYYRAGGDLESFRNLLARAVTVADGFDEAMYFTQAYAYSYIVRTAAEADPEIAKQILADIDSAFPDAEAEAKLAIAAKILKDDPSGAVQLISQVVNTAAADVKDPFDRAEITGQAIMLLGEKSPEDALKYGPCISYEELRSEAFAGAAGSLLAKGGMKPGETGKLVPEAFCQAEAWLRAAEIDSKKNPKAAEGFCSKALDLSRAAGSPYLIRRAGAEMAASGGAGLEDFFKTGRMDAFYSSEAALDLARRLSQKGPRTEAARAFGFSVRMAGGIKNLWLRSSQMIKLAKEGADIDKIGETKAYGAALQSARRLGLPPK